LRIELFIANVTELEALDHFEAAGFPATAVPMTGSYENVREPGVIVIIYANAATLDEILEHAKTLMIFANEDCILIDTSSSVFLMFANGSIEVLLDAKFDD